jgi:glutamate racemase
LLEPKIREYLPADKKVLTQGTIVAGSLAEYLVRHPEMESRLGKSGTVRFYTTDDPASFDRKGALFFGSAVRSEQLASEALIH